MTPYGVTRSQWVKPMKANTKKYYAFICNTLQLCLCWSQNDQNICRWKQNVWWKKQYITIGLDYSLVGNPGTNSKIDWNTSFFMEGKAVENVCKMLTIPFRSQYNILLDPSRRFYTVWNCICSGDGMLTKLLQIVSWAISFLSTEYKFKPFKF